MAQYGYIIDVVRLHQRGDESADITFDEKVNGETMQSVVRSRVEAQIVLGKPILDEKYERAFWPDASKSHAGGQALWFRGEAGRYGSSGNTTNVDSGARTPFTNRDASMTPKRSLLWLPDGAAWGLMFNERVGSSHLKWQIDKYFLKPAAHKVGGTAKIASFIDVEAWAGYIDEADGFKVSSVWRPTIIENEVDGSGRIKSEGELRMALTGGAAARVGRRLRGNLREMFAGGAFRAIEIDVPEELRPYDQDGFERTRVEVQLDGKDGQKRTLVFERESPPAFVYQLGGALTDKELLETWQQETVRIADLYGSDVLPAWHA